MVVFFSLGSDDRTYTGWGLVNLVLHVTALQTNFHQNFVWQINNVLWTVSVECQFYLFLVAVFLLGHRFVWTRRGNGAPLMAVFVGSALAADPIYRAIATGLAPHLPTPVLGGGDPTSSVYTWNFCYFLKWFVPGIGAGWLAALAMSEHIRLPRISAATWNGILLAIVAGIVVIVLTAGEGGWRQESLAGWPLNALLFAALILVVPHASLGRFAFGAKPLLWVGTISYGLYLWHYTVTRALSHTDYFSSLHGWSAFVVLGIAGLAASTFVAACSYFIVERPAMAFGKRLRRSSVRHPAPVVVTTPQAVPRQDIG